MTSRPISQFPEEWGLTKDTHNAVVDNLGQTVGIDFSQKDISYLENTEVDIGTYMKALREVDGRKWHDRAIDALIQWNMNVFNESEYDLLLREIDHNYTETVHPGKPDIFYEKPLKKGDIDFARVNAMDDKLKLEVYEVKTHEEDLEASNQLDEVARLHSRVEGGTGSEFEVVKREMLPQDVSTVLDQINDPYGIPKKYHGTAHYTDESRESLLDSDEFSDWRAYFLANDNLTLEYDDLLEEIGREEFL